MGHLLLLAMVSLAMIKGLVKSPLRRAVITSNLSYRNSLESIITSLKHFPTMIRNTLSLILKHLLKEEKINSHYQLNYAEKSILSFFHLMVPWKQKLIFVPIAWKVNETGKKSISMIQVTRKTAKNLTLMMKPKKAPAKV